MTTGDNLWTGADARAELHVGTAAVRLSSRTATGLLNLDDRTLQMKLSQGTLGLRIRSRDEEDTLEVDIPAAAISALRTGEYRVEVSPDGGETRLIVWSGQLDVAAPGQTFVVHSGQQARVYGADPVQYEVTAAPRRDSFDDFCSDRDRREERVGSLRMCRPR